VSGQSVFLLRILRVGAEELTIQQLIQEQRARIHSANPAERLAAALLIPAALSERLHLLGDPQLAQLLEDEVWSRMNLLAPESTICLVAADRLRQRVNGSPERERFGIRRKARRSWTSGRDEGVHLLHAEAALYRARIPHLLLPFQRNKFASDTFMVPCVPEAKACLCHAGFRETPRSLLSLVDIQTGRSIRLYEDRT
jgi:hypothetical protein